MTLINPYFPGDRISNTDDAVNRQHPPDFGLPTNNIAAGHVVSESMPLFFSGKGTKNEVVHSLVSVLSILSFLVFSPVYAQTPAAPAGLKVTAASETAISLSWAAPPGEVDAYNVFRCEEGPQACTPEWYVWLKGGETTTYTDDGSADPDNDGTPSGLTPGATYRYAVLAINYEEITTGPWPEHQGPWSNQVTVTAGAQAQK